MKPNKPRIFIFFITVIFCSLWAESSEELSPVKMTFINDSRFPIHLHFYNHETLIKAHLLKQKKKFELAVDHGIVIHLEYAPSPSKTVLVPIDSVNQISRTVIFSNDGEHVRIKEQFKYAKNAKIDTKKKKRKKKPEEKKPD
ncbi:MAG: hypothetical protein KAT17_09580 [Candidatus Aminicenantes bacterium]|nr:hypothetical protein [Candidatus Aminicenantes bacterium]